MHIYFSPFLCWNLAKSIFGYLAILAINKNNVPKRITDICETDSRPRLII